MNLNFPFNISLKQNHHRNENIGFTPREFLGSLNKEQKLEFTTSFTKLRKTSKKHRKTVLTSALKSRCTKLPFSGAYHMGKKSHCFTTIKVSKKTLKFLTKMTFDSKQWRYGQSFKQWTIPENCYIRKSSKSILGLALGNQRLPVRVRLIAEVSSLH